VLGFYQNSSCQPRRHLQSSRKSLGSIRVHVWRSQESWNSEIQYADVRSICSGIRQLVQAELNGWSGLTQKTECTNDGHGGRSVSRVWRAACPAWGFGNRRPEKPSPSVRRVIARLIDASRSCSCACCFVSFPSSPPSYSPTTPLSLTIHFSCLRGISPLSALDRAICRTVVRLPAFAALSSPSLRSTSPSKSPTPSQAWLNVIGCPGY